MWFTAIFSLCISGAFGAYMPDQIISLPGLDASPTFTQYSGYLNASSTKKLHYWFVEAQTDPKEKPLLVWLNGGPGCSSVLGLLTENGPFKVVYTGHYLTANQYSWNKLANVLFIESPAGVGFSYDTAGDVRTNDDDVAQHNFNAVKDFMSKFPEYEDRPFFISGESYGGIYVPMLSSLVAKSGLYNFKGFAVGNGLSDRSMNSNSILYFAYYHGLLSTGYFHNLLTACCGPEHFQCNFTGAAERSEDCKAKFNEGMNVIYNGDLNEYNLYSDCARTTFKLDTNEHGHVTHHYLGTHSHGTKYAEEHMQRVKSIPRERLRLTPPCLNETLPTIYLNTKSVREALHIPDSLPEWTSCSAEVNTYYSSQYPSMKPFYLDVLNMPDMNVLVYNGDVDMACNYLGDEWFVEDLGLEFDSTYHAWYYNHATEGKQVAGFAHRFKNGLTYTTVRGAGHMVPSDRSQVGFEMMQKFLSNQPL